MVALRGLAPKVMRPSLPSYIASSKEVDECSSLDDEKATSGSAGDGAWKAEVGERESLGR